MMTRLFWLTPAAIICTVSTCFAIQYLSIDQAQRLCFPQATRFVVSHLILSKDQMAQIEKKTKISVINPEQKVWKAYNGTMLIGWFIADEVIGKHDWIKWSLALHPDGRIKQVEILEYRETYGGEIRNEKWRSQFIGKKSTDPIIVGQDIQNISGATLSSRHVTEGIKRVLALYDLVIRKN